MESANTAAANPEVDNPGGPRLCSRRAPALLSRLSSTLQASNIPRSMDLSGRYFPRPTSGGWSSTSTRYLRPRLEREVCGSGVSCHRWRLYLCANLPNLPAVAVYLPFRE